MGISRGVGQKEYVARLEWQEIEPYALIPAECTVRLDDGMAQNIMDQLWDLGYRPTEGTGSAGAMSAVQEHLKDLRRIVFKEKANG